jgi:predicted MFS family arabinose efflux permease
MSSARSAPAVVDMTTWRGRALLPVLLYVGILVAMVSSLGSPLIPSIAVDYGVSVNDAQWSLTILLVVGAVATPVVGRLGDGPHRRLVLLTALATLVVGNVCAALPGSFALLIIGRGLQGAGLALTPLAMSIARDHLPPERARSALATISVTAVVGIGLGYPLTGLIAAHFSFHVAFWLAAAMGTIGVILAAVVVPTSEHQTSRSFDGVGAVTLGLALAGLLLSISEGGRWGWASATFWVAFGLSLALLGAWAWQELRIQYPLVNLRLMRHRTVLATNVTTTLAGTCLYMIMPIVVIYVQAPKSVSYGLGASVLVAGLVLVPFSAVSVGSSRLVSYLSRWVQADALLPLGVLAIGASNLVFAFARDQLWQSFVILGITGIGVGSVFAVAPRLIVGAVPANETSSALALTQVMRSIGFSIGSALTASILAAHTASGSSLPSNSAYTVTALVGLSLCVLTAAVGWLLRNRRASTTPPGTDVELSVEESVDAATAGILIYESNETNRTP